MLNTSESILRKLILHRFSRDKKTSKVSDELISLQIEDQTAFLKKILLASFNSIVLTSEFYHPVGLDLNVLFTIAKNIYDGKDFKVCSKDIFRHLTSVSKHPGIKDGDLFIAKFDDIKLNNKYYEAIGIYKIETEESFIEIKYGKETSELKLRKGVTERKIDKACLVVFTKAPYTVFVVDKVNVDTAYWIDEFIKVTPKNDDSNNTGNLLNIARQFILQRIPTQFDVTKKDQIEYLTRVSDYVKNNDKYIKSDFNKEVFYHPEVIKAYIEFDGQFRKENGLVKSDLFNISKEVVKKQLKGYKRVIKLDRNFHIYIHGDNNLIEKGYDNAKKMNYYKVYFDIET